MNPSSNFIKRYILETPLPELKREIVNSPLKDLEKQMFFDFISEYRQKELCAKYNISESALSHRKKTLYEKLHVYFMGKQNGK